MSKTNGTPPADRSERVEPGGNFPPEVVAWMGRRSAAIAAALNRKGMPMSYGDGKPKGDVPAGTGRKSRSRG